MHTNLARTRVLLGVLMERIDHAKAQISIR
jgi:hypothetical protein